MSAAHSGTLQPTDPRLIDWYLDLNDWRWPAEFWKPQRPPWAEPQCWEHALGLGAYAAISNIVDHDAALAEHRRRLDLRPPVPRTPPPLTVCGRLVQTIRIGRFYYAMMRDRGGRGPAHGQLWSLIMTVHMAHGVLRWWRWPAPITPIPPTQAALLATARGELLTAERKAARLDRSLAVWIDNALHARRAEAEAIQQRDHAQACLAQALAEKEDLTTRVLVLEGELRDMERSRDAQADIAAGLRDALKAAKARRGKR